MYEIYRNGEWKPWSGKHDVLDYDWQHLKVDLNENGYPLEVQKEEDGSIMGGSKNVIYKNGKIENYDWNFGEGKFEDTPEIHGSTMSSTADDGVTTKTTRIWDGNAMVVSSQSRSWVDANGWRVCRRGLRREEKADVEIICSAIRYFLVWQA